jgi:hypothetical protein
MFKIRSCYSHYDTGLRTCTWRQWPAAEKAHTQRVHKNTECNFDSVNKNLRSKDSCRKCALRRSRIFRCLVFSQKHRAFRNLALITSPGKEKTYETYSAESVEITNKMQPCNRIYYYKVYWWLNMFRAAYHPSSGALNCICSLWLTVVTGRCQVWVGNGHFPLRRDNGQRLQIQFRAPDDERYAARNMLSLQ